MKIGIIHTSYLERGGEDVEMEQECEMLKANGMSVSVLRFKNPKSFISKVFSVATSAFNINSFLQTKKWIRNERPDVVHVHNWHFRGSPSIILAAKYCGKPVVHSLHNFRLLCPSATLFHNNRLFLDSLDTSFPWYAVRKKVYHDSVFQTFCVAMSVWIHRVCGTWRSVDAYIVLTLHAKELFISAGKKLGLTPDRVFVKSNFTAEPPAELMPFSNSFLFVGRLIYEKGIINLLEAFHDTGLQLSIIGDGPLRPIVEKAAAENKNIKYLGFRDRNYILNVLRNTGALLCPSIWLEGNPITIIEALGSGTPVICSKLGAMEYMVTDGYNGRFFTPGDTEDLRRVLMEWMHYPKEKMVKLRKQARDSYQSAFTPEKNFEQLLTIYKSVIYEKSRGIKHPGTYRTV